MSPRGPSAADLSDEFELRCDAVHPLRCEVQLRAGTRQGVVALACEHGAHEHGFTRGWYSPRRLAAIDQRVSVRPR